MNNGPTPISAGLAGAPLSPQTMESRHNTRKLANAKTGRSEAICDTLETNDREPDGRQPLVPQEPAGKENQTGDHLDLTG